MSRKHHCKHPERGVSNYPKRKARKAGVQTMDDLRTLRRKQIRQMTGVTGDELESLVNDGLSRY